MATIKQGILGPFSGTVGNVVEQFYLRISYNSYRLQYVDESFKHQMRNVAVWNIKYLQRRLLNTKDHKV